LRRRTATEEHPGVILPQMERQLEKRRKILWELPLYMPFLAFLRVFLRLFSGNPVTY
jgi:hypothetical protein